jgi:DSF synthase
MDFRELRGVSALDGAGDFTQLSAYYDEERQVVWMIINPSPRPSFTPALLSEIQALAMRVRDSGLSVKFWVTASQIPGMFSAGGDLDLFVRCIKAGDRETLLSYAHACIDCVDQASRGFGVEALTVALVEGSAFGGGLECALAHNFIVAQEDAKFAFPEIKFNLFPGMGAYPLVARRAGTRLAERMIASGERYKATHLVREGLIDSLFKSGMGPDATNKFIDNIMRHRNGIGGVIRARHLFSPVTREALIAHAEDWVESAFKVGDSAVAYMERLVKLQSMAPRAKAGVAGARNDLTLASGWTGRFVSAQEKTPSIHERKKA